MTKKTINEQLVFWLATIISISSCISEKEYIVESDYSYDGNFRRYRTFDFIKNETLDTTHNNKLIEKTLLRRLVAQGYNVSERKPDLVVSYKIFYKNFDFGGFNQPNFEYWVGKKAFLKEEDSIKNQNKTPSSNLNSRKDIIDNSSIERGNYVEQRYQMNEGTLFVAFYDRKKKKTIWQGYASGVFARTDHRSDQNLYSAASKILDEFRLIANGFLIE